MTVSSLQPPGNVEIVHARRTLVLAPHFDDEVLGCGGLIHQLAASGARVEILFLTDGSGGVEAVEDREAYASTRRAEAAAAAAALGVVVREMLDLPDGGLAHHAAELAEALARHLDALQPDLLLVPSPIEVSADHRAAFEALHTTLSQIRAGDPRSAWAGDALVLVYEINHPFYPNLLVDVSDERGAIGRAMACYASQEARHRYLDAALGLRRYRTHSLPTTVEAAEAYVRLTLSDFTTHSHAGLVTKLGGVPSILRQDEGPQISVVVRTKDRPELLAEALASLEASRYRKLELVLVNDGGHPPEVPAGFSVPLVRVDLEQNRGRAAAANAGIAAASGSAVAFLDDDDLVAPEHFVVLADLVQAAGVRVAYTDAAVGVYTLGDGGWSCLERRLPYSRDFDPDRLLVDNFIPFNTLLIERDLFEEVGTFDESLHMFEDWDWLIRCAAVTTFHHRATVTCEYRQFRGGGHHVLGDQPRARADFLATKAKVLAKHRDRLTPERLAAVVDALRAEAVAGEEAVAHADDLRRQAERRAHALRGALDARDAADEVARVLAERQQADIDHLRASLAGRDAEIGRLGARAEALEGERAGLESVLEDARREQESRDRELHRLYDRERDLETELAATYAEIERLGTLVAAMEGTRAWRMHQWWQKRRG